MSDMYNELGELDIAINRFDGACAMVGMLMRSFNNGPKGLFYFVDI